MADKPAMSKAEYKKWLSAQLCDPDTKRNERVAFAKLYSELLATKGRPRGNSAKKSHDQHAEPDHDAASVDMSEVFRIEKEQRQQERISVQKNREALLEQPRKQPQRISDAELLDLVTEKPEEMPVPHGSHFIADVGVDHLDFDVPDKQVAGLR